MESLAGVHLYFVQAVVARRDLYVQEVPAQLFEWIRRLPTIDNAINEPNLLQLERYPDLGLFQPTNELVAYYGGVVKLPDNKLVPQFHYFLKVKHTKLQPSKKKPYVIADFDQLKKEKNASGDNK